MFNKSKKKSGFTLIEVLIVVVIMAVLAATIIPQFASSTDDAKASALKFNLHTLRSQIEMYKLQHNSQYPASTKLAQSLTQYSNAAATVFGTTPNSTNTPFGPYIQGGALPVNPYDNVSPAPVTEGAASSFTTTAGSGTGWLYDPATGTIAANTTSHTTD